MNALNHSTNEKGIEKLWHSLCNNPQCKGTNENAT